MANSLLPFQQKAKERALQKRLDEDDDSEFDEAGSLKDFVVER